MVLSEACRNKQTILACTKVIIHKAARLKIPYIDGRLLLDQLADDESQGATISRVRKNKIFLSGAPAPIAGNNQFGII